MYLTHAFISHLPDCPACLVVLGNLLAERGAGGSFVADRDAACRSQSRQSLASLPTVANSGELDPRAPGSSLVRSTTATIETANQLRAKPAPIPDDHFRHLVTATSAVVYHTDSQGEPLTHNTSWYEFTGQTTEQARGGGWMNAVHPNDREEAWRIFSCAIQSSAPYEMENRLRRKDGEWRYLLMRGVPIPGPDGIVREWMGYGHDITERKALEARLLQDAFLGRRLTKAIRGSDFAARLGGDEFMVILTECPPGKVQMVLDRIAAFETAYEGHTIGVASSCGWAQYEKSELPENLIRRADAVLYRNKHVRQLRKS